MLKKLKFTFVAASVALLTACGGGGDAVDSAVGSTVDNPLAKYVGTYYACDGNTKEILTAAASGSNSLKVNVVETTYQNDNCSGAVVGTYSLPEPYTIAYQDKTTANFPAVTILPSADSVDRGALSIPAMTAQLTGSGVSGSCVTYANGNICYDSLSLGAVSTTGALYLKDGYLVTLVLENGVLEADAIYSTNPSFNYNQLTVSDTTSSSVNNPSDSTSTTTNNTDRILNCIRDGNKASDCIIYFSTR